MDRLVDYARDWYKRNKEKLGIRQKLLFKWYYFAISKYDKTLEEYGLFYDGVYVPWVDNDNILIIKNMYTILLALRDVFDEERKDKIDKDKLAYAHTIITDEIDRLNDMIDKLRKLDDYYKPYAEESIDNSKVIYIGDIQRKNTKQKSSNLTQQQPGEVIEIHKKR